MFTSKKNGYFLNTKRLSLKQVSIICYPMNIETFEEELTKVFSEYENVIETFRKNVSRSTELLERLREKVVASQN